MKRRAAFTLIELLIASSMAAVLLFLAAAVFMAALRGRTRIHEIGSQTGLLRRAYQTVARDLHSALPAPDDAGMPFGYATDTSASGTPILQLATSVGEPLLTGGTTTETELVRYVIEADPRTNRPTLFRQAIPYSAELSQSPQNALASARLTPLLPGVTGVNYLFYSTSQTNWVDTWDGEVGMPTAVRIDLQMETTNPNADPRIESWTIVLPAAQYVNDQAQAALEAASGETGATGSTAPAGGAAR
jgi:type II secretory pathway component PulJ